VRAVLLNWLPWLLMMRRPGRRFTLSGSIFGADQPQFEAADQAGVKVDRMRHDSLLREMREVQF